MASMSAQTSTGRRGSPAPGTAARCCCRGIVVSHHGRPARGNELRSLGEHRLKDLRPEKICQLTIDGLRSDFPPIRSIDSRPNNLPTQLTSFVGREAELAERAGCSNRRGS